MLVVEAFRGFSNSLVCFVVLSILASVECCLFGGHMAEFSWIVRIVVAKTSAQLCIGNLVSEHFIMSPVSCYRRWSALPKDYYPAKELVIVAGRDEGDRAYCSQERLGYVVTAHSNFSSNPHENNIAILEVANEFQFDENDLPFMPYLSTDKENVAALLRIQKVKPICHVPTFKQTKYLRNLADEVDSMRVQMVDHDECWNRYCPRGHKACLPFFNKKNYVCAQFVDPKKRCMRHDIGAPLVCNKVTLGVMKICRDNRPMIFQGHNINILESLNRFRNMSDTVREFKKKNKTKNKRL